MAAFTSAETRQAPVVTTKKISVREQSRRQRQDRIRMVARQLLAEHGYDATTLRQVSECCGMAPSTLFKYITDKRDLIYLIFNPELRATTDICLAAPRSWQTFSEKILAMVEPLYRLFGIDPNLARIFLREVMQDAPNLHRPEHLETRDRFIQGIQEVIVSAQQTGELGSPEDPALIARIIFFVYSENVRWWLTASAHPDWRWGVREFAMLLELQVMGLFPRAEVSKPRML